MIDHKNNDRPHTDSAHVQPMPHTTTEVRQADKRKAPLRVLIWSTALGLLSLGLIYIIFAF